MFEQINKLIIQLMAVQSLCKDIHYTCKGESFYSKHLLVDRIQENLNEYIDTIKEIFFLAKGEIPESSAIYLANASNIIPPTKSEDKQNFENLQELIIAVMQTLENINTKTKGESSLIDSISQDLQQSLGLVNRQLY